MSRRSHFSVQFIYPDLYTFLAILVVNLALIAAIFQLQNAVRRDCNHFFSLVAFFLLLVLLLYSLQSQGHPIQCSAGRERSSPSMPRSRRFPVETSGMDAPFSEQSRHQGRRRRERSSPSMLRSRRFPVETSGMDAPFSEQSRHQGRRRRERSSPSMLRSRRFPVETSGMDAPSSEQSRHQGRRRVACHTTGYLSDNSTHTAEPVPYLERYPEAFGSDPRIARGMSSGQSDRDSTDMFQYRDGQVSDGTSFGVVSDLSFVGIPYPESTGECLDCDTVGGSFSSSSEGGDDSSWSSSCENKTPASKRRLIQKKQSSKKTKKKMSTSTPTTKKIHGK